MSPTLLVAHASKYGSTEEVAEAIARTLRARGLDVDVRRAGEVRDIEAYAGVVLGGGIYAGRWHRDARRLLRRNRSVLAGLPLAVFGMGPRTLDVDAVAQSRRALDGELAHVPDVHPRLVAIFGGVVDPAKLHFPLNRMPAFDARDWSAIRAWAGRLPESLGLAAGGSPARGGELRSRSTAHC